MVVLQNQFQPSPKICEKNTQSIDLKVKDFLRSLNVIVLAGGKSERMGVAKGLLPYKGQFWLLHQLLSLEQAGIKNIFVVFGFAAQEYQSALTGTVPRDSVASVDSAKVRYFTNHTPEAGPFSSLQTALKGIFLNEKRLGWSAILPIDVPCALPLTWNTLAKAACLAPLQTACIGPYVTDAEGEKGRIQGGHPVLLAPDFGRSLLNVPSHSEEARLDRQIQNKPEETRIRLPVADLRVIFNLNTPADFERYLKFESNAESECKETHLF